ncbi:non-ribosomal peptide synthetase [Paenibacillus sp. UMB4589-SE434]|uniref:non-ribosomal peptide synthetase n=1 Tax=Paenibacillus sp. UMB4589-SE434 TaxID=3046314 RepID=UPI0025508B89|nr:non-ribosomal peptide synthetase [Paenibacillus sp. UMB4589-SE434]MDK8179812.1 amino acid adenylation domain-containing protein [Paenibacillus sp. UMB4589-SE434]
MNEQMQRLILEQLAAGKITRESAKEQLSNLLRQDPSKFGNAEGQNKQSFAASETRLYDLSHAQRGMWLQQQMEPGLTTYNCPFYVHLHTDSRSDDSSEEDYRMNLPAADLNRAALEKALQLVAERHESLRTAFEEVGGEPKQKIYSDVKVRLQYADLRVQAKPEEELERQIWIDKQTPFDLSVPPVTAKLFQLSAHHYCYYVNMHHIIMDGWSTKVMVDEMFAYYRQEAYGIPAGLPKLPLRYVDYVQDELLWERSNEARIIEQYWLNELSHPLPTLRLIGDYEPVLPRTHRGGYVTSSFSGHLVERLTQAAKHSNVTMHMLFLACYVMLLHKLTGEDDIIVGVPVLQRSKPELQHMVGVLINVTCIRVQFDKRTSLAEIVAQVKEKTLLSLKNSRLPFERIVSEVNPNRVMGQNPIFSTLFQFFDYIPQANDGVSMFDLSLQCRQANDSILLRMEYASDLFERDTVERYLCYYMRVIERYAAEPSQQLSELQLLERGEEDAYITRLISSDENRSASEVLSFHQQFERQAALTPNAVALKCGDRELSYSSLNARANQLAHSLRSRGVGPEGIVGLLTRRTPELIIGMLGILKAGGAYVAIDPAFPEERIRTLLQDCGEQHLLTEKSLAGMIPSVEEWYLDDPELYADLYDNPICLTQADHLAYVLYTSGSTGRPKGVMITHGSLARFVTSFSERIPFTAGAKMAGLATVSFDIFVVEHLIPLTCGMTVVLLQEREQQDPRLINDTLLREKVDILQITPSRLKMWLREEKHLESLLHLKILMIGAEVLTSNLLAQVQARTKARIYNLYGPTETTVWMMSKEVTSTCESTSIPIGTPLAGVEAYVLDEELRLQPPGVAGELCIGGSGVGRGYMNDAELTASKFVAHPFQPGQRMYRTGDRVRLSRTGEYIYLGRADHQVKVRGYRIELGEIEQVLLANAGVSEAIVHPWTNEADDRVLCAYWVSPDALDVESLRSELARRLPDYMIPAFFLRLVEVPLTPTGKVNRKALPDPFQHADAQVAPITEPKTDAERQLFEIWKPFFHHRSFGVTDDFYTLGGNSIMAIQMRHQLEVRGYTIDVANLFQYRTIRGLAPHISKLEQEQEQEWGILSANVEGTVVLTDLQLRYLQANSFYTVQGSYFSAVLSRESGYQLEMVKLALSRLVEHHDGLRIMYYGGGELPAAYNRGMYEPLFRAERCQVSDSTETASIPEEHTIWGADTAVNMSIFEPLIEAKVIIPQEQQVDALDNQVLAEAGSDATRMPEPLAGPFLALRIHRLLADEHSWSLLLSDFSTIYEQLSAHTQVRLPAKTVSLRQCSRFIKRGYEQTKLTISPNRIGDSMSIKRSMARWQQTLIVPISTDRKYKTSSISVQVSGDTTISRHVDLDQTVLCLLLDALQDCKFMHNRLVISRWLNLRVHDLSAYDTSRTVGWMQREDLIAATYHAESRSWDFHAVEPVGREEEAKTRGCDEAMSEVGFRFSDMPVDSEQQRLVRWTAPIDGLHNLFVTVHKSHTYLTVLIDYDQNCWQQSVIERLYRKLETGFDLCQPGIKVAATKS